MNPLPQSEKVGNHECTMLNFQVVTQSEGREIPRETPTVKSTHSDRLIKFTKILSREDAHAAADIMVIKDRKHNKRNESNFNIGESMK